MTSAFQDLQRGQGLFAGALGSLAQRLRLYLAMLLGIAAAGAIVATVWVTPRIMAECARDYGRAQIALVSFNPAPTLVIGTQGPRRVSALAVTQSAFYRQAVTATIHNAKLGAAVGGTIGALLCVCLWWAMRQWGAAASADASVRGSTIVGERALGRLTRRRSGADALRIATVPWPETLETRHLALVGTTGSGKTTVLRQLLDGIEARGEAALVYDTSGEFVAHYYRPERGDVILNPFDARGAFWSPFDEIEHPADADRIAHQLVATSGRVEDDVWLDQARILVANILRALWREGRGDLTTFVDILQSMTKEEMKEWLAGTSSARTFEQDADKATSSVLFMLARCSNLVQYLRTQPGPGGSFSFQRFFKGLDRKVGPKPWIFVPRKEDYFDATRPLLACFLESAAAAILGLEERSSRRVWLILDELPDLPKVDSLARLLPQGRKFGAAVVLTFQAIGQMRQRYGQDGAEALLANSNTKLFLQLVDPDTRRWASQTIGDHEVEIRGASESLDYQIGKGRTSLGSNRQIQPVLIESQFRLAPHQGILQLPDGSPVARVVLRNDHIRARGAARQVGYAKGDVADTFWGRATSKPPVSTAPLPDRGPV